MAPSRPASFSLTFVVLVVVFAATCRQTAEGARILAPLFHPMSQASHNVFVGHLTRGLRARNHFITVIGAETYDFHGLGEDASSEILTFRVQTSKEDVDELKAKLSATQSRPVGMITTMRLLMKYGDINVKNCEGMFDDTVFMKLLRERNFDLLLAELFVPCDALLAAFLNIPFVVATSSIRFPFFDEDIFNMDTPSSYFPFQLMGGLTDDMTFLERTRNFLDRYVATRLMHYFSFQPYKTIQSKHGISPIHSIRELVGKADLWLSHTDFVLDFPRPTAPNWIPIGGLVSSEAKPLSQNLEDFVQRSGEHGVIVFSLGSTDVPIISKEGVEHFADVFSEAPQHVIWKFQEDTPPRHLGNNTRLMKWIPQFDLVCHPKTRLLIYHGGLSGVYEAIRCKVPMVLVPLFADQSAIAARVAKKGFGVVLDKTDLSVKSITSAIKRVLDDSRYRSNVDVAGAILADSISTPLERSMFWIEHIIKYGGGHLKSRAGDLNFFAHNSLDVIAFLAAVIFLVIYLFFLVVRRCSRWCIKKEKSD